MRKTAYFDGHWGEGWPDLNNIESCLIDPKRRGQFFASGRDGGSFGVEGLYGTEALTPKTGRVDAHIYMFANPDHGVMLQYSKWDGRIQKKDTYNSKGDLSRLRESVRSFHGTPLSVGLFIPFAAAWNAVKEFIETDGELPKSIEWVASRDLPPSTFPDP